MAEYIEREAISEEIRKYYYKNPPNFSYGEGFDRGLDRAQRAILDAPSAEVVEVVRCQDCKHAWIHPCGYVYCHMDGRNAYEMTFNLDSFCSYGERKDNG